MSSLSRSSSNPSNHNILTKYDAVIIGAGLGGLTSAALLANAGKQVLVLERNAFPGGAATTYQRGPLTIEASLHETTPPGSAGDPKRDLFEKIGLVGELEFVEIPWFQEVRWPGIGAPFRLPHGLEAVQTALHEHFPEAEKGSRLLIEQLHRTLQLPEFASPEHNLGWRLNHLAELPLGVWAAFKDVRSSLGDVFRRYFGDNEAIKFALSGNLMYYGDDPDKLWWMAYAMAQGSYMKWGGYYIRGGSQQLTNKLVEAIENAGGHVLVNCPATQIELDGAGVAAVRYRDKNSQVEHRIESDHLLANAAPQVVSDMLPEQVRSGFMAPYQQRELSISLLSVSLGLDRPPAEFGISSYSTVLVPAWMKQFSDYPKATELFSADPDGRLPVMCIVDYNQIDSGLPFAKDLDAERA
ncbi:MAG: phytoene desaturase family protein, partial [Oceanobacter sp.]